MSLLKDEQVLTASSLVSISGKQKLWLARAKRTELKTDSDKTVLDKWYIIWYRMVYVCL